MRVTKVLPWLVLFVVSMCPLTGWAQTEIFRETFDDVQGKGGNDGEWKGTNASGSTLKNYKEWHLSSCSRGSKCIKLGTTSEKGKATTPELTQLNGEAMLTFRAGSWMGDDNVIVIKVKGTSGASISPSEITLPDGSFGSFKATITGGDARTQIMFESKKKPNPKEKKSNRFFLDDVVVTLGGGAPSPSDPPSPPEPPTPPIPPVANEIKDVEGLGALRALTAPTEVRLTLSADKPALVNAVKNGDAYVSNDEGAVVFRNFLPNDRGWCPTKGGKLVGTIVARYEWQAGMPTLVSTDHSSAYRMLCPAGTIPPYLNPATANEAMTQQQHRATVLQLPDVQIIVENNQYFIKDKEQSQLAIQDEFGVLNDLGMLSEEMNGRNYELTAIVGAQSDDKIVLLPIGITEKVQQLSLMDSQDNNPQLQSLAGKLADVEIQRTLVANMWNALCLPFALSSEEIAEVLNAKVAQLEGYDLATRTLKLALTEEMQAGEAYLVYPSETIETIQAQRVRIVANPVEMQKDGVSFKGFYAPEMLHANDKSTIFIGQGNLLHYPSTTSAMRAFRAYFRLPQNASIAPKTMVIDGENSTLTLVESVKIVEPIEEPIYNLAGQRVISTRKLRAPGVYISQGKKMLLQ